jgi:hypothetical protein
MADDGQLDTNGRGDYFLPKVSPVSPESLTEEIRDTGGQVLTLPVPDITAGQRGSGDSGATRDTP